MTDGFDDDLYLGSNPDLRAAFDAGLIASALDHWRETGAGETRNGARPTLLEHSFADRPAFPASADGTDLDAPIYLALNPDLAGPLGGDTATACDHWVAHGAVEGRIGFGAPPPWDRAFGRPIGGDALATGCDLFVEADPFGGDEAALGRRLLGAFRAVGFPASVRAYTSRDGRLVLADRDDATGPARQAVLVVATPALCRQILAAIGPDRLAGRTVLACFGRAPLRRHMPDWPLLSSLDAVLVPEGSDAALFRAISPVPVHEVAVVPAVLAGRGPSRRLLGLADSDRVVLHDAPDGGGVARCSVVRWGETPFERSFDDVPDPWTGASRLLAAADHFVAAPSGGSAIRRADAEQAELVGPSVPPPPAPTQAAVGAKIASVIGGARGGARGAARLPIPRLPAGAAIGPGSPVLSVLAGVGAITAAVLARLDEGDWGFFELCVALPIGRAAPPCLAGAARCDPRIRLLAAEGSGSGPGGADAVATGTHLLPVFDAAGALRLASGLARIAERLVAADAPDLLVDALDERELRFPSESPLALPIRDRLEHAPAAPVAVSRAAFDRVDGATLLGAGRGSATALTLSLLRDGGSIGAVALPSPDCGQEPDPDQMAAERALRRHVAAVAGEAATVEPGFLPSTFRIRRHDAGAPRFTVLRLDFGAAEFAATPTEHVLLVGQPIAPPRPELFAAAAELLADPGIGAVCPVTLDADGLIAEAGLFATGNGMFEAGPERGWPFDACGPGRSALRVRNVHAAGCALLTRRSLLREVGPSGCSVEAIASTLGRAGWRLVATPWATVRLLRSMTGTIALPSTLGQEGGGDGWPSGLRQRS